MTSVRVYLAITLSSLIWVIMSVILLFPQVVFSFDCLNFSLCLSFILFEEMMRGRNLCKMHNDWSISFHGKIHKTKQRIKKKDLHLFMHAAANAFIQKQKNTHMHVFHHSITFNFCLGSSVFGLR